jgi:nicotinamidase-related amidase
VRLKADETMAVVIDYQEKLMPVIYENDKVIENTEILIKGLRELEIPIVVSQQYTKGLGETIKPIKEALGEFTPMEKKTFSLMDTEEIKETITKCGKKNVVVCGTEAHICVLQTVIDLREAGYNVFLVSDCIGSRKINDKKAAIKRAMGEGAFICTYESVLYELTAGAGNPHFKAISKLTK